MQDDDTTPKVDGSTVNGKRQIGIVYKQPKHRSLGLRHALATERGLCITREKNTGRNRMKRPVPSLPKLPWND